MMEGLLLAQVIGFLATALNTWIWQIKSPKKMLLTYLPTNTLWAIHYAMIGGTAALVISIASILKDSSLFASYNRPKHITKITICIYITVITIMGLWTINHWFDLLPLLGICVMNLCLLDPQNRSKFVRGALFSGIMWLTYGLIIGSWPGALSAAIGTASNLVGMIRYEKWEIGRCYRTFAPSLVRSLFTFPNFRTFP